jgi:hypothetical protein
MIKKKTGSKELVFHEPADSVTDKDAFASKMADKILELMDQELARRGKPPLK